MKHPRWHHIPVLGAAMLILSGCGILPKEISDTPPVLTPPVKSEKAVYTARLGDIADEIVLRSLVAPARTEDLAWPGGGRVAAVYVKAGDRAKRGQILAEVRAADLEQQVAQADLRFQKAQLGLDAARYNAQFSRGGGVDFQLKSLELDLESARLDLERLRALLAECRLAAPFDGTVQAVNFKPGDLAAPFAPAVTLVDPTDLIISADVDSTTLPRLAPGQVVRLEFSEMPNAGTGRIVQVPDPRTEGGQPLRLKVQPDGLPSGARMGMAGNVRVVLQQKTGVVLLPNAALRQFNGRNYVLLEEPRREVDVVLGIAGATETEIVQGLKAGEKVIGR